MIKLRYFVKTITNPNWIPKENISRLNAYCDYCVRLLTLVRRDPTSHMRCDPSAQKCNPHSAHQTQVMMQMFHWEFLGQPPYTPDLALLDCHLFGPWKQHVGGYQFHSNEWLPVNAYKCKNSVGIIKKCILQELSVLWIVLKNNGNSVE